MARRVRFSGEGKRALELEFGAELEAEEEKRAGKANVALAPAKHPLSWRLLLAMGAGESGLTRARMSSARGTRSGGREIRADMAPSKSEPRTSSTTTTTTTTTERVA